MSYTRTVQFNSRRGGNWNRNQNTVAFASAVKLGPITHTVIVALMITVLGLIYLTQATRASGYDYAASETTEKISALTDEKNDLAFFQVFADVQHHIFAFYFFEFHFLKASDISFLKKALAL